MISIDDSLFAQIENDAFLSGTFGLEGNRFSRTAQYLKQYLEHLKTDGLDVPEGYEALVNNIASLVDIESEMEKYSTGKPSDVDSLAEQIANKASKLNEGESVLIPGGWQTMDDGHAMVYQFTRQSGDNYQFTVFNSGAGLEYHAKKSAPHQELYNPTKIWQFNKPDSPKVKLELGYFIGRLLKPTLMVTRHHQMKPMTSETLYNEILPSISHIGGVEKDANATIKAHAYTGGQLSGTCSQRVLHQMLKINAKTDASYQQFIFKFKHYALLDYATLCFANKCPFTPAVADQIHLAIENNLKILNNGLFNAQDTERYLTEMNHIKQSLGQLSFSPQTILKAQEETVLFNIDVLKSSGFRIDTDPFIDKTPEQPVDMVNGRDLLKTMSNALDKINSLYSLEKFMLALPINENGEALFDNTFYQELSSLENFVRFKVLIQRLIVLLTVELNSGPQTAVFNIMALHLATLLADTESVIDVKKGRPSFKPFTDSILGSFINNQKKNPYYATNHPGFDQRFQTLQKRFRDVYYETTEDKYFEYLNKILTTEPLLNKELKDKYEKRYAGSTEDKHRFVREKGIEALYMLTDSEGYSSEAINQHLNFGQNLLHVINPFLEEKLLIENYVEVGYDERWYMATTLQPTWLPYMRQSTGLSKHKYAMQDSPALNALQNDVTSSCPVIEKPDQFSANEIQLRPAKAKQVSEKMELVTQADIEARDYFILRSVPSFQIALTLDYFTQHIDKLADESNQRYIEANLFEPGLLLDAFEGRIFFAQFERLLTTGFHFFSKYGQHTRQSLLFVRLDYLVSRYLALTPSQAGLLRLQNNQEELKKQLLCSTEPNVTYVLQQYLFLTLMTQFELGGDSKGLLVPALSAYFYIKSHTNPSILEDAAHRAHVDVAMDAFKLVISSQPEDVVNQAVQHMIDSTPSTQGLVTFFCSISKQYLIKDSKDRSIKCRADVMSGRLFEGNLARSGVPLAIQHHPLIKQLGLQHVRECLMNQNETYIVLCQDDTKFELSYIEHSLSVRRSWTIESKKAAYVLQPLTADHRASKANNSLGFVSQNLPKILTDGSMNFWLTDNKPYDNGLLTKDNRPVYLLKNKQFYLLNEQGNETGDYLSQPPPLLLSSFESNQFILTHRHKVSGRGLIKLPRYNLTFEQNGSDLVYTKTGERVIAQPMPIHPTVAGIMLEKAGHTRLMVPVNRFYAVQEGIDRSDFYPVVHDTQGVIADASLKAYWHSQPPLEQPLWDYQNSERLVSFQLKYEEPIADSVADALYLVYIYLATNQTEKAWVTLDDCRTRLGGLTGDPAELQFIAWICNDMPHRLPGSKKEAERKTPPYVGCQLKAMSLLCDFLLADRTFDLNVQRVDDKTANTEYASIEQGRLTDFLKKLPETIYQRFSRYQNMDRHLEYTYTLGAYEKKHLLNYYHDAQPSAPLGALGYAWMTLSREAIEQERGALLARRIVGEHLPHADNKRLNQIEQQLKALKPVIACSTLLERVAIDLQLTKDSIEQGHLSEKTKRVLGAWYFDLPGAKIDATILLNILNKLSSSTNEHGFIQFFPAYFQIACSTDGALREDLSHFCMHTLIARRHITLIDQASNITFLCNVLYRVLNNRELFVKTVTSGEAYEIEKITFPELIAKCKPLLVPIIEVYQAKDVYQDLLETPVKHEYQAPIPLNASLSIGEELMTTTITTIGKALEEGQQRSLDHLVSAYRKYQQSSAAAIIRLGETLDSDGVSGEEKADRAYAIEAQAGAVYFAAEQRKKALANDLMGTRGLSDAVCLAAEKEQMRLARQMKQTWLEALTLANRGPDDPSMAQSWRIARLAKGRATLTKANLMSLYCQADVAQTNQATGLSLEESKRLYALIHKALVEGILGQLSEKISTKLDLAKTTRDENVAAQALELLATEAIPGLNDPSIVVIQHEEKILLRTRQVSALKSLLKQADDGKPFHETVEKIIMGGGKSKVILPILAERKAQGHNLVVIEVPQALLETNYVDLNRTSWRLFGKKAYRFEYNRDTNSSPENLERIYQFFTEAMSTRGYLVTTGESIQSLELKYIEILQLESEPDETRQKQLYWLDKITNLFRNYADCIIDEAHQGLSINKKLNYTSGEAKSISPELIINATGFFGLIETEFLLNAPLLSIDYDWNVFKVKLARSLVEQPNSPLFLFVNNAITRYGEGVKQALIDYFSGKAGSLPVVVVYATPEEKEALAFFKQEITVLLPQTLPRRVNVNYGASKMSTLTPIERTVAIPYAASNVPSERSRFGNELEAINYATQMMLINGISKALIIEKIIEWQALSSEEFLQQKAPITLDKTPTAVGFSIMTGGLNLNQIDVKNDMEITSIHSKLQFNPTIMFDLLRDKSLTQIKQDSAIIHSDAFNHVDCYRTVQCVSGTPSNHSTYHQRLSHDKTSSLGSDGYILQLLHHKETQVSDLDYHTPQSFLTTAINNSKARERVRAIIDVNATFKGAMNVDVAKELTKYIGQNQGLFSHPIKHVLYFNDDQILCAIDVSKLDEPIFLGTSEESELSRRLGSLPGERFTYYDQAHTLGIDIRQASDSHALVLIDEKSTSQAFLQGTMRMRELSLGQTVELIVPTRIQGISREALMKQLVKNEQQALLKDNLFAAKGRMTNLIRRNLLSRIQNRPSEDMQGKIQLAQVFKSFFMTIPSLNLFALYGAINKQEAASLILRQCGDELLAQWRRCLETAGELFDEGEQCWMAQELQGIVDKAIPNCLGYYEGMGDSFSMAVETKKEVHKKIEIDVMSINQCYSPDFVASNERSWYYINMDKLYSFVNLDFAMALTLNRVMGIGDDTPALFSMDLMTSINYAETYVGQKEYSGVFLKPVFLIWYSLDCANILRAMIITPQEAPELIAKLAELAKTDTASDNWLSTTDDSLIAGNRKDDILNQTRYQSLREQVRFFNGEFTSLLKQETPLVWLKENPAEKLALFENALMFCRPGSMQGYNQMKIALMQSKVEGFIHMAQHPFEDFTSTDWIALFPKTNPVEAAKYRQLAYAFHYLNQNWMHKDFTIEDLMNQFQLSVNVLSYIKNHFEMMNRLKGLLAGLNNSLITNPLLLALSKQELETLEVFLGMPLETLYQRFGIEQTKSDVNLDSTQAMAWQLASIQSLIILRAHSALMGQRSSIDTCLVDIAKQTTSVDVLMKLFEVENPPQELITALVNRVLIDDVWNSELISKILELENNFSVPMSVSLAEKCETSQIKSFLAHPTAISLAALRSIVTKQELTNDDFATIFLHELTDEDVIKDIVDHRAFIGVANSLIKHPRVRVELLKKLAISLFDKYNSTVGPNQLAWENALIDLFKQDICKGGLEVMTTIMQEHKQQPKSTPRFDSNILQLFKEPALGYVLLNEMIHHETQDKQSIDTCLVGIAKKTTSVDVLMKLFEVKNPPQELIAALVNRVLIHDVCNSELISKILELKNSFSEPYKFTSEQFTALVDKVETKDQIDTLFACEEMTTKLADILFKKPHCSFKIKNWTWLTENQIITVLDKTTDYGSLQVAITNGKLSRVARDSWLNTMISKQNQDELSLKQNSTDFNKKITVALFGLKLKSCKLSLKATNNKAYNEAASVSFDLYNKLNLAFKNYLSQDKPNELPAFQNYCKTEIDKAMPILAVHRGYKKALLDILNFICTGLTGGYYYRKDKTNWRFFKADTDSVKAAKQFEQKIGMDKLVEGPKPGK